MGEKEGKRREKRRIDGGVHYSTIMYNIISTIQYTIQYTTLLVQYKNTVEYSTIYKVVQYNITLH